MPQIIKNNPIYFFGIFLFLSFGGILLLQIEQGDVILFFSERRAPFLNTFFIYTTKMGEEWPYILLILIFLFVRIRYSILVLVAGLLATVVSFVAKLCFAHDRPISFFKKLQTYDDINLVDGVYVVSGTTSCPSGHTISAFILYGLLAFLFYKKRYLATLFLLFAFGVAISRIYLVQHFLKDVYLGCIIGTAFAVVLYLSQSQIPFQPDKWFDQSFFRKRN